MSDSITITEVAAEHILKSLHKRGKGLGIRVKIKKTGCSGYAYAVEFVDQEEPKDQIFPLKDNYSVYVDPKSFLYVKGMQIDYVKEGLNEGLKFVNPNEKNRCGCGESFTVD